MANHVDGYLSVVRISEEGQKVWDAMIAKLDKNRNEGDYEVHLGHLIFENFDDDWDFNRMCDEIGAKWAYARDYDSESMSMYSAWSPCGEFVENLAIEIGKVDPSVELVLTYEDEFPNFIGVCTYNKEGADNDRYIEWDELQEIMMDHDPELRALWDEDEQDWKDEDAAREIMWEIQYDVQHQWQDENTLWSVRK